MDDEKNAERLNDSLLDETPMRALRKASKTLQPVTNVMGNRRRKAKSGKNGQIKPKAAQQGQENEPVWLNTRS